MKYSHLLLLLFCLIVASSGCKKNPGEGGKAIIAGTVYYDRYDLLGNSKGKVLAIDERVHIIYGDDDFYGDNLRTHLDGTYQFQYLRKGSYTIFAYEDCDTCTTGLGPVQIATELNKNNQVLSGQDLMLKRILDYNDGTSTVTGTLYFQNSPGGQYFVAPNKRIFILYENANTHFKDIRTNYDGSYLFNKLISGTYTIFAYSNCTACPSGVESKIVKAAITKDGQTVTADSLKILE